MSRVFMRFQTDAGPRTKVFSASDEDARHLAEMINFDGAVLLPDDGPYLTIAQMVAARAKTLDREIARHQRRKPATVHRLGRGR